MSSPLLTPELQPEEEHNEPVEVDETPVVVDLGDIIHTTDDLIESDLTTVSAKFYHSDDQAIAQLPKANQPPSGKMLAIVAAIGGTTVALLGVGGYALNRARLARQPELLMETLTEAISDRPVNEGTAATEARSSGSIDATIPGRQYSFNWAKDRLDG